MEIAKTLILLFWSSAAVALFCEFGQMVTEQFEMFDDELKRCQWYLFPIEMQRSFGIAVANSQQSMNIRGFGNMKRTREALKNVHSI